MTNSNNLACSISANTLTCTASGGSVTLGAGTGQFEVSFSATPNAVVTLVNPRAGGVCSADPNNVIAESVESNNDCLLNTVNARTPVYLPLIAR